MSEELRGRELKMVVYDESAHVTQKLMDHLTSLIESNIWGATKWGTTPKPNPCALCKVDYFYHGTVTPHPFFNNNLEYLEYESTRKGL